MGYGEFGGRPASVKWKVHHNHTKHTIDHDLGAPKGGVFYVRPSGRGQRTVSHRRQQPRGRSSLSGPPRYAGNHQGASRTSALTRAGGAATGSTWRLPSRRRQRIEIQHDCLRRLVAIAHGPSRGASRQRRRAPRAVEA